MLNAHSSESITSMSGSNGSSDRFLSRTSYLPSGSSKISAILSQNSSYGSPMSLGGSLMSMRMESMYFMR